MDFSKLQEAINTAVDQALERHIFKLSLPPLLTKNQLMDMLDIKNTKASELLNREDFPVIREFGNPRVPTQSLLAWIDEHTEWVRQNAGEAWVRNRKGGVA
ncbi:hypothetical protein PGLA_25030 [Paenibacillus glacialis]|uniref:Uncharacterized protein n=2 Tax=Paenibacillus glacialis TaxID=494026 RepID=A0A168DII6_9BACL|nr:hypothetical protein PGLA_25030 [Paenibacillus glacialis]